MVNSARSAGYTLIELLIVLTIMTLIGTVAFFNLRTLREDQDLKTVSNDLQTRLRVVQSNASSSVNCKNEMSSWWEARIFKTKLETRCEYDVEDVPENLSPDCVFPSARGDVSCLVNSFIIDPAQITVDMICEGNEGCETQTCKTLLPATDDYISVIYSPVFRDTKFSAVDDWPLSCIVDDVQSIAHTHAISVVLNNSRITDTDFQKSTILIEKGGVIRAQ